MLVESSLRDTNQTVLIRPAHKLRASSLQEFVWRSEGSSTDSLKIGVLILEFSIYFLGGFCYYL